jgi:hypothetical protein
MRGPASGRPRWRGWWLAIAGLVIVAGLVVAGLSVEPARSWIWQQARQACGTVAVNIRDEVTDPASAQRAEECFARAYARCRAATLDTERVTGIDTSFAATFVVEQGIGSCRIVYRWTNSVDAGMITRSGVDACAGLRAEASGLRVLACGAAGDIFIPSGT